MEGISRGMCLEIFTNPHDLEIVVSKAKNFDKWVFVLTRGPRDRHKVLLEGGFFRQSNDAVDTIKKILEGILEFTTKELKDPKSLLTELINSDHEAVMDPSKILTLDLITRIVEELQQHQTASTYKMMAAVPAV